tara:strand:- start:4389 stop:4622 length:234 start_codon:yes stop_codon:yes gene_type:complete
MTTEQKITSALELLEVHTNAAQSLVDQYEINFTGGPLADPYQLDNLAKSEELVAALAIVTQAVQFDLTCLHRSRLRA